MSHRQYADFPASPPEQLGGHHDWVAIINTWEGVASLAADGSLWLWPDTGYADDEEQKLMAPSKRPIDLGSILK